MRESGLVRWAMMELRKAGWYVVKTCPPIQAGTPDLLCSAPSGRFVAIEMKAGSKGKVSPLQAHRLEQIRETGAGGFVCRNRDDVRRVLNEYG